VAFGAAAAGDEPFLGPNGQEEAAPEILAPAEATEAAVEPAPAPDHGNGDGAQPAVPAPKRAARRPRRRSSRAEAAAAVQEQPEVLEPGPSFALEQQEARSPEMEEQPDLPGPGRSFALERPEAQAPNEPELAAADERRHAGPPRRGWWSRFVRKDE
jgi:hypothetical protein